MAVPSFSRIGRWGAWLTLAGLLTAPMPARATTPSPEAALSRLYAEISPAIVNVVSHRCRLNADGSRVPYRRLVATGLIIDGDGRLVTTDRVAQQGDSVIVYLADGRRVLAEYLGGNADIHIALLQLDADRTQPYPVLEPSPICKAELLPEWIATLAYGPWHNQSPDEPALTLSRRDAVSVTRVACGDSLEAIWRIDMPYRPGNSGGALITLDGQWVGLLTGALASPSRTSGDAVSSWEAGLVVPAGLVLKAVREIRSARAPERPFGFLGVSTRASEAAGDSLRHEYGVIVADVLPGSPADEAGLLTGDVILRFHEESVDDVTQLTRLVAESAPQAIVPVDILRNGVATQLAVRIGDRTSGEQIIARRSRDIAERAALLREIERYQEQIDRLRLELRNLDSRDRNEPAQRAAAPVREQSPG